VRVAVLGLGLIGGSAALALEARGYDRDAAARARARGARHRHAESLGEAVKGTEVVLLAVPTSETATLLREAAAAAPNALFTDAASLKRSIAAAAAGALTDKTCFVRRPSHGGVADARIAGARADLFQDRPWLVVPTDRSDVQSIAMIQDLVRGIGARPASSTPSARRSHDLGQPPSARRRRGARAGGVGGEWETAWKKSPARACSTRRASPTRLRISPWSSPSRSRMPSPPRSTPCAGSWTISPVPSGAGTEEGSRLLREAPRARSGFLSPSPPGRGSRPPKADPRQ
jgi:hypothetical protein